MEKHAKYAQSAALREQIEDLAALVLIEFDRLTVAETDELRRQFRVAGCTYHVYKNSIIHYAVTGTRHEALSPLLKGVSGLAFHADDPGAPARVARDYVRTNDKVKIKGAVVEGQVYVGEAASAVADMPGPREIKAKLLSLLNTPATRVAQVIQAAPRDILRVLTAKQKRDEAA